MGKTNFESREKVYKERASKRRTQGEDKTFVRGSDKQREHDAEGQDGGVGSGGGGDAQIWDRYERKRNW